MSWCLASFIILSLLFFSAVSDKHAWHQIIPSNPRLSLSLSRTYITIDILFLSPLFPFLSIFLFPKKQNHQKTLSIVSPLSNFAFQLSCVVGLDLLMWIWINSLDKASYFQPSL